LNIKNILTRIYFLLLLIYNMAVKKKVGKGIGSHLLATGRKSAGNIGSHTLATGRPKKAGNTPHDIGMGKAGVKKCVCEMVRSGGKITDIIHAVADVGALLGFGSKKVKRAPAKRAPAKRATAKRAPAKRAPAKRAPAKRAPAKKLKGGDFWDTLGSIAKTAAPLLPLLALGRKKKSRAKRGGRKIVGGISKDLLEE
jgi:hypothetical protein